MPAPPPPYPEMVDGWPLVGRDEEIRRICDAVGGRDASGIVLSGTAGVGKTRLARECAARARSHGLVCRTVTATASARSIPLGAFADYARSLGPDLLDRITDVADAVAEASERVLLIVDDAHLLDDQSALVVAQLVRQRRAALIVTVRQGETVCDAVRSLWKDDIVPLLSIQPLSVADVITLAEAALGGQVDSASAQRFWQHTHGNILYLRQLLVDERAAGHIREIGGVFVWEGRPQVSATLADLVAASIGRQPPAVLDVVDTLAAAGILDLQVLADICGADAVDAAEIAGMILVDTDDEWQTAQLAHPLYGEVRMAQLPTLRVRGLRGRIADALRRQSESLSPVQKVRLAVLSAQSDTAVAVDELVVGARAAVDLLDADTAETLARAAVRRQDCPRTRWTLYFAHISAGHLAGALQVAREIRERTTDPGELTLIALRIAMVAVSYGEMVTAEEELARVSQADSARHGYERLYQCAQGSAHTMRREWQAAIDTLTPIAETSTRKGIFADHFAILALILSLAAVGRIDATHAHFDRAWNVARALPTESSYGLALTYAIALEIGGYLDQAHQLADRIQPLSADHPRTLAVRAETFGKIADACGDLAVAQRWLREAGARFSTIDFKLLSGIRLRPFLIGPKEDTDCLPASFVGPTSAPMFYAFEVPMTDGWKRAVQGDLTHAIEALNVESEAAQRSGALGVEVMLRQEAVQLGCRAEADRLTELTRLVDGPRVHAAAKHATGLAAVDADQLMDAAAGYEAFGDRVAAADAAAQAACVFRHEGRRGAAMTATAMSDRIAEMTGACTPARKANSAVVPLTMRQREILELAATGLSNREIAREIGMSVRTVEGHIFRASQRTGTANRHELIAVLRGQPE